MQDQFPFPFGLCIQGFLQGTDRQVTGDVPVCDAGHHTPFMEVNDAAVIPYFMILHKQVCEVRTPPLVWVVRLKFLIQPIFKYLMRFPMFMVRLLRTDDGTEPHFHIHILMYGCGTVGIPLTGQVNRHAPITVNPMMLMVDLLNLCLDFLFMGIEIRLPVLPVVIVSIGIDPQPVQQPADAEFVMVFVNEPISL